MTLQLKLVNAKLPIQLVPQPLCELPDPATLQQTTPSCKRNGSQTAWILSLTLILLHPNVEEPRAPKLRAECSEELVFPASRSPVPCFEPTRRAAPPPEEGLAKRNSTY